MRLNRQTVQWYYYNSIARHSVESLMDHSSVQSEEKHPIHPRLAGLLTAQSQGLDARTKQPAGQWLLQF